MCRCNFYKNCGFINNLRVHSLSLEICQRKNTDKYFFPDIGKLLNQIEKATGSYFFFFLQNDPYLRIARYKSYAYQCHGPVYSIYLVKLVKQSVSCTCVPTWIVTKIKGLTCPRCNDIFLVIRTLRDRFLKLLM